MLYTVARKIVAVWCEDEALFSTEVAGMVTRCRMRRRVQHYGGYDLFTWLSGLLPEQRQLYVRHYWRPTEDDSRQIHAGTSRPRTASDAIDLSAARYSSRLGNISSCWCQRKLRWLIEHGFTSAPTQYRLYGRRFLQVWWPYQQCQLSKHWRRVVSHPDRPQSNQAHPTVLQ